jgi:hypothetical protein
MTSGPRPFASRFLSIFQSAAAQYELRANGSINQAAKSLAAPSMVAEATKLCIEHMRGDLKGPPEDAKPKGISSSLASCAYLGFCYLEALVKGDQLAMT